MSEPRNSGPGPHDSATPPSVTLSEPYASGPGYRVAIVCTCGWQKTTASMCTTVAAVQEGERIGEKHAKSSGHGYDTASVLASYSAAQATCSEPAAAYGAPSDEEASTAARPTTPPKARTLMVWSFWGGLAITVIGVIIIVGSWPHAVAAIVVGAILAWAGVLATIAGVVAWAVALGVRASRE